MVNEDRVVVAVRVRPFNDREKSRKAQLIIEMPDRQRTGIRDPNASNDDPKWFTFAGKTGGTMVNEDRVVVAVRVRPFNDREKSRKAQLIIEMPDRQRTGIRDPNAPNDEPKWFTFDHSYWSHDEFKENSNGYLEPRSDKYADQKKVFDDLGKGVLDNAWKGYNCSLFAYGQTGSGKSYSMVGFEPNKGIIPLVCEELFRQIEDKKENDNNTEYQVSISMFEIYCEKVRDLLNKKEPPKGGLKVREHPKTGFYVENLTSAPVSSYEEIEQKMNEGTKQRTIAATDMNATSSRAHTVVKIQFNQKSGKSGGGTITKTSEINLVDLAGSERQKEAGSDGERLKEGIVINQSLSTLGRVIKALHEQQNSKSKKNIQIAALSPADINYEETLSTLRFADRAKSIMTKAVINESASERMIRELKEENARLQDMIASGGGMGGGEERGGGSNEEIEQLRRQLAANQKEMKELEQTWQQRLDAERSKVKDERNQDELAAKRRKEEPHLWNLNEDPALTNMIVHFIEKGTVVVGTEGQIQLNGMSIQPKHAILRNENNKKIYLTPAEGAEILVNGKPVQQEVQLKSCDRILFGGNHLYVFQNPKERWFCKSTKITYDMAQQEIAKNSGLSSVLGDSSTKSTADLILEEDLVNLLPNVYRANSMSKELKKNVTFEIALISPEARGLKDGLTEIWIKVSDKNDDSSFLWEKNRFMNRYYGMQEIYQNYMDGDLDWDVPKEQDPFYEPPESETLIGSVPVFLQSLAYLVEYDEHLPIADFGGQEVGQLEVGLIPCTLAGQEILGQYVEKPLQLDGRDLSFKVRIVSGMGLPRRIEKSFCRYRFFDQPEQSTKIMLGTNPAYGHEALFKFKPVTKDLVHYLESSALYVTVWGTQRGRSIAVRPRAPTPTRSLSIGTKNSKPVKVTVEKSEKSSSSSSASKKRHRDIEIVNETAEILKIAKSSEPAHKSPKKKKSSSSYRRRNSMQSASMMSSPSTIPGSLDKQNGTVGNDNVDGNGKLKKIKKKKKRSASSTR